MKLKTSLSSSKVVAPPLPYSDCLFPMIYRVTLTKGWISKDIRHCGWKTIIFRWLWLFANLLIRGDCWLLSPLSALRMTHMVWRLMCVCVIINKPRVTGHTAQETEPSVSPEMEPALLCCQVARKLRNRLPGSGLSPPSPWHLLNITDLIFIVGSENISLQIGNGFNTNRGECWEPVTRCHEVMTEECERDTLLMTSVQSPGGGQVTRSVFAIFLVIWCHDALLSTTEPLLVGDTGLGQSEER